MMQRLPTAALLGVMVLGSIPEARPEAWVEVTTPALTVVSDGSEKEARKVAARFEEIRALLKEAWPWARFDPPRPVTVLAVRDEKGLERLLPATWEKKGRLRPAGFFTRSPQRFWVVLRMDVARFREGDDSWDNPHLLIFHEYVHLVLDLNFERLPVWLNEGLAEYWGSTIIQGDRVYIGQPIRHHLRTLRGRAPLPLSALFAVTHESPEYTEQSRANLFYAQSWALTHYLAVGSKDRRGQLDRFARLLLEGRTEEEAAAEAFGDLEALDRELASYVRRFQFPYLRRAATITADTSEFAGHPLREAQSLALRASFHVMAGRPEKARALAEEALALEPGLSAAQEALGLVAWQEGRPDQAIEALRRATARPDASDFAHYLLGRLLWQRLTDLDEVEASFRRAVELNPSFADAFCRLAQVMDARGASVERTLPLAAAAARIEPGNVEYVITALRLAGRGGEVENALAKARRLRDGLRGADRDRVEQLIAELSHPPEAPPESTAPAQAALRSPLVVGEDRTPATSAGSRPPLVVVVDILVEDSQGRPVVDVEAHEIEVVHGAEKQRVATLRRGARAGRYELRYTPLSGEPGAVYVRSLRPGTRVRAPQGDRLRPRLVTGPTVREREQDAALDAALDAGSDDFSISVEVFRFEASPAGVHHTVAVELPLASLPTDPEAGLEDGRLMILARFRPETGGAVHRLSTDRPITLPPYVSQSLVWCGNVHLPAGRYQLDVLVREATTGHSATRRLTVEAPEAAPGLGLSSPVLLRAREVTVVREGGEDDPLFFGDRPVMPDLDLAFPTGSGAPIRFFVVVYPDAESDDPPSLELELLHRGERLGGAPLNLPPPDARGEIRYVGLLATSSFRAVPYTLRLVARQGDASVTEETSFEMRPAETAHD